ncbi:hypothetical protein EG328_012098 [Venturia inaequalis]|uniref:Uncharacterized protein n=1 Tax=Venturia inaequalis TaxID=5025 RepID=A0A8H3YJI5_VENIN|nr:hypothetical protein EG328_012098 [Venturia inaequalis]
MKIAKVTKAPIIILEEKVDLLATKEAGEVEGYDLILHEQRLLNAREEYDQVIAGARKFLEGILLYTNESYKAPKKFGQDSSDEELLDTPSSRPAKKAKLAKLSDSNKEEIAEDEPLEEPS